MNNSDILRQRAESLFLPIVSSGGASSVSVPSAASAIREKSARLKALRMARDVEPDLRRQTAT